MTDFERAAWATVGWHWHERCSVRAGELPDDVIARQLAATVFSKHWWEAQRDENGQPLFRGETLERAAVFHLRPAFDLALLDLGRLAFFGLHIGGHTAIGDGAGHQLLLGYFAGPGDRPVRIN